MKVETKHPQILRFEFYQEEGDPDLGSCLWAIFDLDPDKGILNLQSDCGNYAYRWPEKGREFMRLMAGMGKDKTYLLRKLVGRPKDVDVSATLEGLRERYSYESDIDDAIDILTARFDDHYPSNTEHATCLIEEWADEYDFDTADLWECVVTRYTSVEERIVSIFCENIVPEITRYLEDEPDIQNVVTLSTIHIRPETAELIDDGKFTELSVYKKEEYGWWIYLPDYVDDKQSDQIPEDLKDCITYAKGLGCCWLCLDCDGQEMDCLKKYEW